VWNRHWAEFCSHILATPTVNHTSKDDHPFPFEIDGLCLQSIRQQDIGNYSPGPVIRRHSKSTWELDVSRGIPEAMKESMKVWMSPAELESQHRLRRACYYMISDGCSQLEHEDSENWVWHHQRFYKWMKRAAKAPFEKDARRIDYVEKQPLYDSVSADNAAGELTCRVVRELASIVQGSVAPLESMMQGDLLNRYYQELPRMVNGTYKQLKQIIRLYAIKEPGAKVLEVGAGTGGTTAHVLDAFAIPSTNRNAEQGAAEASLLGHYDFTDISPAFFTPARSHFAPWVDQHLMGFRSLDIEADPSQQGFAEGAYDLIVAGQVLHTTANLHHTLSNVRKLLKPRGKLIIVGK
jgi:2-polyprenyl-3-methyl-5-hydroxy-6-metoxy-1,4-benzoquinol methylase